MQTIRINSELHRMLKIKAIRMQISLAQLVERILQEKINQKKVG